MVAHLRSSLLFVLLQLIAPSHSTSCPVGGQLSADNQRCFFLQNLPSSFSEAEGACVQMMNGHLTSIRNGFDNTLLMSYISDLGQLTGNGFWIGGNRLLSKFWQWSDGAAMNYTNWAAGEPADSGNCAAHYVDRLTWLAYNCDFKMPFVCEAPAQGAGTTGAPTPSTASPPSTPSTQKPTQGPSASTTTPQAPTGPPGTCTGGYTASAQNCYKVISTQSAASAESSCQSDGAHLVSIHSDFENDFVANLAQQASPTGNTWIGLQSSGSDNNFSWIDGSSLDYTHWRVGQPSTGYQYVMMYTSGESYLKYWEDWEDNHPQVTKAVCKKKAS